MDAIKGQLTPTALASVAFLVLCYWRVFSKSSILPDLPVIGYDQKQWFAWPRTLYFAYNNYRVLYKEAYDKYLSQDKACVMPEPNDTQVILPNSLGQWLVDQPDSIMSAKMRQNEFLQTQYTFPIPKMAEHPYHLNVIKRDLTRKLSTLTGEIWEELEQSFDNYWGTDTEEWREINLMETMIRIVTRTSNRLFVGKEACRNEKYLNLCTSFAQDVPVAGILIRMVPGFLQPIMAPIITLPNRYHNHQIRSILRPEIERRLAMPREEAPNDFMQWFINFARDNLEAEESSPRFVADRMATVNFAAIHTSTFSIVNALADIVSLPDPKSLLETIKDEMEDILKADGGEWTKTSVQRMVKADSTLRESMRYSSFMTVAIQRKVIAKGGITTPTGIHIKEGNKVGISGWSRHRDAGVYPDADTFIPLRFVEGSPHEAKSQAPGGTSAVDSNLDFLTFSHGRHVCPGRFFAANELKLALAFVAMHYDVEPLLMEPKVMSFGSIMAPNPKLSVKVRRKVRS